MKDDMYFVYMVDKSKEGGVILSNIAPPFQSVYDKRILLVTTSRIDAIEFWKKLDR